MYLCPTRWFLIMLPYLDIVGGFTVESIVGTNFEVAIGSSSSALFYF